MVVARKTMARLFAKQRKAHTVDPVNARILLGTSTLRNVQRRRSRRAGNQALRKPFIDDLSKIQSVAQDPVPERSLG